jgi:hypothetical protein
MSESNSVRDSAIAAAALGGEVPVDVEAAYRRFKGGPLAKTGTPRWLLPVAAMATAAAFACAFVFTPLGGYAGAFLTIFQPREFQPITLSTADMHQLRLFRNADEIGTQRVVVKPRRTYFSSVSAAQKYVAFPLREPGTLPSGFGTVHSYFVFSPGALSLTFNAARAQAFARRSHETLPPMPASLNGTTVMLRSGDVFNAHYETGKSGRFFELIEMQAPRVTSTGASLQTLKRYVLAMPKISPALASQIRALGENSIPVPVNIEKQYAQHVSVDGVQGLAIGDNTGLGAGVLWQKGGIMYVVGGPLSMADVLTVANGLH